MHTMFRVGRVLCASLLWGSACSPAVDHDTGPAECPNPRSTPRVYNGTLEPTWAPLTGGQKIAIGKIGDCTGTLIAPRFALAAAHCGLGPGDAFCIGAQPDDPSTCLDVEAVHTAPDADVALIELTEDAGDRLQAVEPIPILVEALDASWVGQTAEAAGYGLTENGTEGTRYFTAEPILAVAAGEVTIDGGGERGMCSHDSGGPLLVVDGAATVRVAGVLSFGDETCLDHDTFARVDEQAAWIALFAGPAVAGGSGCGSVDAVGRCIDGAAFWCEAEVLRSEVCDVDCGWDGTGFRCIDGNDPCAGVDGVGVCDGSVARWCVAGVPRAYDCATCEGLCDLVVADGGATCVDDPCHGLDYFGQCDGTVAEWCENGAIQHHDCAADDLSCGWVDSELGYWCL